MESSINFAKIKLYLNLTRKTDRHHRVSILVSQLLTFHRFAQLVWLSLLLLGTGFYVRVTWNRYINSTLTNALNQRWKPYLSTLQRVQFIYGQRFSHLKKINSFISTNQGFYIYIYILYSRRCQIRKFHKHCKINVSISTTWKQKILSLQIVCEIFKIFSIYFHLIIFVQSQYKDLHMFSLLVRKQPSETDM